MSNLEGPGPGWYPDPERPGRNRWWNGTAWEPRPADETPTTVLDEPSAQATSQQAISELERRGDSGPRVAGWVLGGVAALIALGIVFIGAALFAGASDQPEATDGSQNPDDTLAATTTPAPTTTSSNLTTSSTATTASTETPSTTATTSPSTTTTNTTAASTTATSTTTTSTTAGETSLPGQVLEPGDIGFFTSPSGNIACNMSVEFGASCWISEKQWEIDQPGDPDCAIFDWGNAIDVNADGVLWPCYSDMGWPITADPLAYGDRMRVGQFECVSARDGVTCRNGAGDGFRLARAAVDLL